MRKVILLAAVLSVSAGCLTQKSEFPVLHETALRTAERAPVVGLAPVQDDRQNTKAGHVGGARITTGPDAIEYVSRSFTNKLHEKGFKVVKTPVPSNHAGPNEQPALGTVTVVPILQSASITSADAILFPAVIDVDLAAKVCDERGKVIYVGKAHGAHRTRLWLSSSKKKFGKLLATAMDQALDEIVRDPKFDQALK
jgi:hypothetical protein